MSLFKELKRRNVIRVAAAYLVIGWLVVQIIGVLLPMFDVSESFQRGVVLLLLIGFLPVMLFSWAYEITPEGIKKEKDIQPDQSIALHTAKKLDIITLVAVLGAVGLFAYQQMNPAMSVTPTTDSTTSTVIPADDYTDVGGRVTQDAQTEAGTQSNNSALVLGVAVLPFSNLSEDPNNAFFAGGVHEDVLTQLSYIRKLRVISRTSMLKVAERGMEVREIGSHLGVSHVLEGSVRRAGEQVRVTVQLIDAATDEHVWADNFDRKLDDIFAIQSEIAEKIAAQLKAELTPDEIKQIEQIPTSSNEAYDLYVKAREFRRVWRGAETFKDMLPLLEKAVALDSDFVKAQEMLTEVYGRLVWTGSDPTGEYKLKALETLNTISQKHPDSIEAANALSQYLYTVERDYAGSLKAINKVLDAFPNDTEALLRAASCYKRMDNFAQGLPLIQKAASLDPEHSAIAGEVVIHLLGSGMFEQAYQVDQINLIKFPNDTSAKTSLARTELEQFGNIERYNELIQQLSVEERYRTVGIAYDEMNISPTNIDKTISALDEIKKNENPFEAAFSDVDVARLLNTVGREQESQKRAKVALAFFEKNEGTFENYIAFRQKQFYAAMTYLACLANDKSAFKLYEATMQSHKVYEVNEGELDYALAIAECGDIPRAWALLFKEANSEDGLVYVTTWDLALNPTFQYYFSELPEYQKMVADLEASKEEAK